MTYSITHSVIAQELLSTTVFVMILCLGSGTQGMVSGHGHLLKVAINAWCVNKEMVDKPTVLTVKLPCNLDGFLTSCNDELLRTAEWIVKEYPIKPTVESIKVYEIKQPCVPRKKHTTLAIIGLLICAYIVQHLDVLLSQVVVSSVEDLEYLLGPKWDVVKVFPKASGRDRLKYTLRLPVYLTFVPSQGEHLEFATASVQKQNSCGVVQWDTAHRNKKHPKVPAGEIAPHFL